MRGEPILGLMSTSRLDTRSIVIIRGCELYYVRTPFLQVHYLLSITIHTHALVAFYLRSISMHVELQQPMIGSTLARLGLDDPRGTTESRLHIYKAPQ